MVTQSIDVLQCNYLQKTKCISFFFLLIILTLNGSSQNAIVNDSIAFTSFQGNPDQIVKYVSFSSIHYVKIPNNRINFGITGCEYRYLILKLNSRSTLAEQYISIDNTSLDTVSIYKVCQGGIIQLLYSGGNLVIFNTNREYVWHTAPVEVSRRNSVYLIALKAAQKNINLRYEILGKDDLRKKYLAYDRFVFIYTGMFFMITIIIILAFFLFRKAVFAAYFGYVLCTFLWIISHYGLIFPFAYPHIPVINEIAKPVSSLLASICLIIVLRLIFWEQIQSFGVLGKLFKAILYSLSFLTSLMLLLLFRGLNTQIKFALIVSWHLGLIFSAAIIMCTPLFFIKRNATAKIFFSAMLLICIMTILQLFGNLGNNGNYFINEHGMALGSLVEISMFAFGLFYNLLKEHKGKENKVLALELAQTDTLKKLITLQESERKRIAADLHDNIGPLLAALKINFRRIIHMSEIDQQNGLAAKTESIIDDSIAEIRNIAHNLMPKGLSMNGLINTLKEHFEGIQNLYNKTILFDHQVKSILNHEQQVNVYRIICELLLNAVRHSNAGLIAIKISADDTRISITIEDNGCGFSILSKDQKNSVGLQSAEGRVQYLKGTFCLKSEPGKGTKIHIEIPLQFDNAKINGF